MGIFPSYGIDTFLHIGFNWMYRLLNERSGMCLQKIICRELSLKKPDILGCCSLTEVTIL